ncbi:unnamed protein product [Moneuplotes crassus]|uniref:Uncharacterized protein n=1 Tax=Euplotes crassus TaxID=5936 RepID=A0AAD1Y7I5_EUPCR|nr:unnamed protein product [Moneuplotes crassus]
MESQESLRRILDPRGSHEVIIEQVEEEKQLSQKQNLRYKYLQMDDSKSLMKIHRSNLRSRRKSLNDAYCTPLMRSDSYLDIRINEMGNSPKNFDTYIHSQRERREIGREARNQNNMLPTHANSEGDLKNMRNRNYMNDFRLLSSRRKEERKSNSDTHSPFGSFNDQVASCNPIDDYGRNWTSATLGPNCETDFWEVQDNKSNSGSNKDEQESAESEKIKIKAEENKVQKSISDLPKNNIRLTYLSASSLSDDRWVCPICLDIFDDAVETPCCHNLFCEKCIVMAHLANDLQNKIDCPLCNKRYDRNELIPNIPIRRLVNELSIKCINIECHQVFKKGDLQKHLKICKYQLVSCPNSSECELIIRKNLRTHEIEQCPFRIVPCRLRCGVLLPLNTMEDHIKSDCMKETIKCKNSCGKLLQRCLLEKHLRKTCPLEIIKCPNAGNNMFEEGCSLEFRRCDMQKHEAECEYRKILCENGTCGSWILFKDLEKHDEQCPFKVINCKNKCGAVLERQDLLSHYRICELEPIECTYYQFGCTETLIRKKYKKHLEEKAYEHSLMFVEGQKRINMENEGLKRELLSLSKDYDVEIKAMFLELNRVKEELSHLKQSAGMGIDNVQNSSAGYHDNPLNSNRPNTTFEKKIPNSRYHGNKNEYSDCLPGESNGSSLENSLFEYSSRSRIYGD